MRKTHFLQGDIVMLDFEPSRGHEPNKQRPAIIVSNNTFNSMSSLTAVCPITSTNNGYPMHVEIDAGKIYGFACVEQLRTLDLTTRKCRKIASADAATTNKIASYAKAIF